MRKIFLFLVIALLGNRALIADEGMWVPLLLDSARYQRMTELGCTLSKEDIFSMNNSSLKDAVVLFDRGCTGVMVSNEGLLFTNHHCGFKYIQNHSSADRDYLGKGFTAKSKAYELPNLGLKVMFLNKIEDVTNDILASIPKNVNEDLLEYYIKFNINKIVSVRSKNTTNTINIKPFFGGNQYLLFEYEVYTDVRLVLAPPFEIGKFGGDTDNWMWPRYTGDFSIFRVYASKNNAPALYSPDNVPYKPKKVANISLRGVAENDFTMVLGYPGHTEEYISSEEVSSLIQSIYPNRVNLRGKRLEIMGNAMKLSPETWIKYSAKYYGINNGWKKWQGAIKGLTKADAVAVKKRKESEFSAWLSQNDSLNRKYGNILNEFHTLYAPYNELRLVNDYKDESILSVELITLASRFSETFEFRGAKDTVSIKTKANQFIGMARGFYKNYNIEIDRQIFASLMEMYANNVKPEYQPVEFKRVAKLSKEKFSKWAYTLYSSSVFSDSTVLIKYLKNITDGKLTKLLNDPALKLYNNFNYFFSTTIIPSLYSLQVTIDSVYREYMAALQLKNKPTMYPDANLTFRISYGKVEGYSPSDAVYYDYYTTSNGILEKENPEIFDYKLSDKLRATYKKRDFGEFSNAQGNLPVCFIASNHTSGGNSGSPVFNARGELIGLNFDRCWEGTMSDILYDPAQCRNIATDIRFLLFVVKNYADAGYLLDELNILKY